MLLGTFIHLFIAASVHLCMDKPEGDSIQLYIGWSLTLVFLSRLVEHTLCLEQLHSCLIKPLYICTWTNLRVTYSGQSRGWSESTLILTNHSRANITRLICVDQSQGLKSAKEREGEREGEISEMKKAPLLCRAALKTNEGS
jgi:hypothetical protein